MLDSSIPWQDVPCHSDFIRYTQWHNHALDMVGQLGIPFHILFYENYAFAYDTTVAELLDNLDWAPVGKPKPFEPCKSYTDLFDDMASIAALIENVATPATWGLLQHYFE